MIPEEPTLKTSPRHRRPKIEATRKQLLLVNGVGHSPWSVVSYVRAIEVLGASGRESVIRIVVRDVSRRTPLFDYIHRGPGTRTVNIPRGELRVLRVKGTEPLTVIAYCGP